MKLLAFTAFFVLPGLLSQGEAGYTNEWVFRLDDDKANAKEIAEELGLLYLRYIESGYHVVSNPNVPKVSPHPNPRHQVALRSHPNVSWAIQQETHPRSSREQVLNDPFLNKSWHLTGENALDMGILRARNLGYTGKGVVVTIVDKDLQKDHPDLIDNYDPEASYDVCDNDPDPSPAKTETDVESHGTKVAGEVAAVANNSICTVGVASAAKIGGVRLLACDVTDVREEQAFSFNPNHIDIYSMSWGPKDDGKTVGGPEPLAAAALARGVKNGRHGKGSIYVVASGNGGSNDACDFDGYTSSPYTIAVSSALRDGSVPSFSEPCAASFVVALSMELLMDGGIATTDGSKKCTTRQGGTSASAPIVAGVIALTLEANYQLTWRDVQHLVVETANPTNLTEGYWIKNGAGKLVSDNFGFGLIDAFAMVTKAKNWTTVPEWHICEAAKSTDSVNIQSQYRMFSKFAVDACKKTENKVRFLEHVLLTVNLTTKVRGSLLIQLISPSGTHSTLMHRRPLDNSVEGLKNWTFSSVQFWGENPEGTWYLLVETALRSATLENWTLELTGTSVPPTPESAVRRDISWVCEDCFSTSLYNSKPKPIPNSAEPPASVGPIVIPLIVYMWLLLYW